MAIPNVKRFRPFCPTCNDNFTLMAVLPKDTNVDKYLADAVARHDHKAFQESFFSGTFLAHASAARAKTLASNRGFASARAWGLR